MAMSASSTNEPVSGLGWMTLKMAANKQKARGDLLESLPHNMGGKISGVHTELQKLADTLDDKVGQLLDQHEKDFFLAYKTHMNTVKKEFKSLQTKASEQETKTRRDAKINKSLPDKSVLLNSLEKELKWFTEEALRLDDLCKRYKQELEKWKHHTDHLDDDRNFLEDQIKTAKKQNKALREALERAQERAILSTEEKQSDAQAIANAPMFKGGEDDENEGDIDLAAEMEQINDPEKNMSRTGVLTEEQEKRYLRTIGTLQKLVRQEKSKIAKLEQALAGQSQETLPLEEFFCQCILQTKQEIFDRKYSTGVLKRGIERAEQLSLLDFTNADKRRVIELLFANQELLGLLRRKLEEVTQQA